MPELVHQVRELLVGLDHLGLLEAQQAHRALRAKVPQPARADAQHLELGADAASVGAAAVVLSVGVEHDVEVEGAPGALLVARHVNLPAHVLHQMLADHQPDAAPLELPSAAAVALAEQLEQPLLRPLRNPDPRVRHLKEQNDWLVAFALVVPMHFWHHEKAWLRHDRLWLDLGGLVYHLDGQRDLALQGELARVGQQVGQHLAQPGLVAVHDERHLRVAVARELLVLHLGVVRLEVHAHVDALQEVEGLVVQLEALRLALVDVQHAADEAQQLAGGPVDVLGQLALLVRQVGVGVEQLAAAEDGVERVARLLAGDGDEVALRLVRLVDVRRRALQLSVGLLQLC
mmetsp:Transcript_29176/g.63790  ORF Transcript_29176/g.63790 Transcript_29176/m.63790 type:complete len:345 (-) Transcript_29176:1872-2906(-)